MLGVCLALIDESDDKTFFSEIYYKYRNLSYTICFDILKNNSDAEDAVAETFLRVAQNFTKISHKICPETRNYIVIISRNISIDILRKNNSKIEYIDEIENEVCEYSSLEENVVSQIMCDTYSKALLKLSQKYYDVLYLNIAKGFSPKDISLFTGDKEDTIRKRILKAKKKLTEIIEKEDMNNAD